MAGKKSVVEQARQEVCAAFGKNAFARAGMYIRFTREERDLADGFDVSAALEKARRERAEWLAKNEQDELDRESGVGRDDAGLESGPRL